MQINSELKDRLLNHVLEGPRKQAIPLGKPIIDIPFDKADMLIDQFVSMGLMEKTDTNKCDYTVKLCADAYDFKSRGGFAAMDEIRNMQLDKLELELKKLQDKFPDKVKLISSAISAIASVRSMLIP